MQGSARDFLKPKLVDSVELSKNEYRVVLEPFERGFGHTLGNSIRRTLLSSMVGSAITEVAIHGVMHEFSTIEGVQEDVLDILLNLKEASIGLNASESATVIIEKEGPCELTVADIEANGTDVSVFNPEKVIATVNEGGKIRMTLGVGTGVGYDVAVQGMLTLKRSAVFSWMLVFLQSKELVLLLRLQGLSKKLTLTDLTLLSRLMVLLMQKKQLKELLLFCKINCHHLLSLSQLLKKSLNQHQMISHRCICLQLMS